MSAGVYDLNIDQGSTYGNSFTQTVDGVQTDFDGYSARSQIRKLKTANEISATFACTISATGKIQISLTAAQTSALNAGVYFWDLEVFTPSDVTVTRILQGQATIDQEVTR
jgi:hypothetical protein